MQRGEDRLAGDLARGRIPVGERRDGLRQGVRDDLVLDRAQQHVADREEEGDEHEGQERRDQHQRPNQRAEDADRPAQQCRSKPAPQRFGPFRRTPQAALYARNERRGISG